eukprot:1696812-Pleurochrysis_carterae.AAC.1
MSGRHSAQPQADARIGHILYQQRRAAGRASVSADNEACAYVRVCTRACAIACVHGWGRVRSHEL